MNRKTVISSLTLLLVVLGAGASLAAWKKSADARNQAASAQQPEPSEVISAAVATSRDYRRTSTSIGTVLALRSITLRNELAGTVRDVHLTPGAIVEKGDLLVALDVAVEEAELRALEAQAELAATSLRRVERLARERAAPQSDVERAIAERDVALARIASEKAVIERKTIRAPFRARVGLADVHPGQFLEAGTILTSLQGVDDAVHVDFSVAQQVAADLQIGDTVDIVTRSKEAPLVARVVAIDARVDPSTRNATVRARIDDATVAPSPGASVRVQVPTGPEQRLVAIPASALRRGPAGDQVFVIVTDAEGRTRAQARRVRTGSLTGDEVLIHEGLAAGERVAAAGSFKLRESVLVAITGGSELAAHGGP
ncbi:MAG: efflux RND transporter periplasmic adaptor subunit [Opitutaceae bacterium]|nr:efflux RND transporter periplasmic adaptor subunit [Opitutaceae bacterium]